MPLDQSRLRAILEAEHSYYGSRQATFRNDMRLYPGAGDLIAAHLEPHMRVLDVGCGNGETLLQNSARFASGVGIDNDPAHLQLAEQAKRARGVTNVEFLLLDYLRESEQLEAASFDFVWTQRGPIGYSEPPVRAALRLLKPDGLLFCEMIGDLHHQEVRELFDSGPRHNQVTRTSDRARVALERSGLSVRLVADHVSKRYYPDIYEWLQFQCSIWAWAGVPLPEPDDPRFALFAQRNSNAASEIVTTHHVVWAGGVKLREAPYGA
jgi:SAM-dependent methyltransferase